MPDEREGQFGKYRILDQIGKGGMSTVHLAEVRDKDGTTKMVALKRMLPAIATNRELRESFVLEAKLMELLEQPNIPMTYESGKIHGTYFIAMEFVPGPTLKELVQHCGETVGVVPIEITLNIVAQICDALDYAHNQTDKTGKPLGIVHRDISPGNIMVTPRGDVKLFDFGIVKATGRVSRTEAGVVKGNVSFMSPEQARGEAVDARSDLFSLGLVIYYGVTNQQIYRGAGTFEQLLQAASGPTAEDLSKLSDLPLTSRILTRALAVDPAQRYQSAAEFAADLAGHLTGGRTEIGGLVDRLFGEELRAAAAG